MEVDDRWTFEEAVDAAWRRYVGGGITSRGYRNNFLKSWGSVVGLTRATTEIDRVLSLHGGVAKAADALGVSEYSLESLRGFFRRLPDRTVADGLTLYFNTRLTTFDRFLVEGAVFGVLGKDTDCHLAEYQERGDTAIVRLEGSRREDLEAVADALWERVWEQQDKAQKTAIVRVTEAYSLQLAPGFTELRDRLDRIELRLPSDDVLEMQTDQAEAHLKKKDLKVVRSWTQKALIAVGKKVVGKVGDEIVDVGADAVKGLLSDGATRRGKPSAIS